MDVHTDFPFKSTSFTVSQSINSSDPWHESLNPEILTTSACRHIAPQGVSQGIGVTANCL